VDICILTENILFFQIFDEDESHLTAVIIDIDILLVTVCETVLLLMS